MQGVGQSVSIIAVAELVAGKVVDVIVVFGKVDASMEIVSQPLAEAVVISLAVMALQVILAPESENQGTAAIAVTLDIGSIVRVRLLGHLHVGQLS